MVQQQGDRAWSLGSLTRGSRGLSTHANRLVRSRSFLLTDQSRSSNHTQSSTLDFRHVSCFSKSWIRGVLPRKLDDNDQYARVGLHYRAFKGQKVTVPEKKISSLYDSANEYITFNVRQQSTKIDIPRVLSNGVLRQDLVYGFRIGSSALSQDLQDHKESCDVIASCWNPIRQVMSVSRLDPGRSVGFIDIRKLSHAVGLIKLGFDIEFNPFCYVAGPASEKPDRWLLLPNSFKDSEPSTCPYSTIINNDNFIPPFDQLPSSK